MKLYTKITIGLVLGIGAGWLLNTVFDEQPFQASDQSKDNFVSIEEVLQNPEGLSRYRNEIAIKAEDGNQDGKLSLEEIAAFAETTRQEAVSKSFGESDLNGDRSLSLNEIMVAGELLSDLASEGSFAAADTSGNGLLSSNEYNRVMKTDRVAWNKQRFNIADKNRDQHLDEGEIVAADDAFRQFLKKDNFKKTDIDKDGFLTIGEIMVSGQDLTRFLDKNEFTKTDTDGDLRIGYKEEKAVSGWQRFTTYTNPIGDIFIRLVKLVVVPLILASLILGAANLGDIKKVGKIGLKAFGFFMLTTAVAVSIGVTYANILRPGDGLPEETKQGLVAQYKDQAGAKVASVTDGPQQGEFEKIVSILVKMVPTNPIEALAEGDMLAIIFFSIFFGLCLTLIPKETAAPFISVMEGLNDVILKMVTLAMETAPYGVFALITGVVANMGIDILVPLLKYGGVVVAGLLTHVIITHFSFIFFYLRKSPLVFIKAIKEAILLGFSTSSSSATLPISMNVTQKNLGVSKEVTSFVLPLGATINMDGTALYQGVAAIFIAQVYQIELSFTAQILMVLTATLASIGAAGVPGAGMITLAVVLGTAGIPLEGIALIFGLDRLLDMFRTAINVIGDITCASVMAKAEGETLIIQSDQDVIAG